MKTIFIIKKNQLQKVKVSNTWFLNSCAFWHPCNDWSLFTNTKIKNINFIIAIGQIILKNEISTIWLPLFDRSKIELQNIVLSPKYNSNLICLGQLRKTSINFYDNPIIKTLMRDEKGIAYTKRNWNLFILEFAQSRRAISTININTNAITIYKQGQPTYFVSQNKWIML